MDRNNGLEIKGIENDVALHPEGVDRNISGAAIGSRRSKVALHPEGVDRNRFGHIEGAGKVFVALHPEGVDRNMYKFFIVKRLLCRPPPGGRG